MAGTTAFALALYAAVRKGAEGNLLVSPYSVSQALAMAYAGAGGATAAQMAETLAFTLDGPALHEAFGALNADLVARGNSEDDPDAHESARGLRVANALWGERTYPFSDAFGALLAEAYGAGPREADFVGAPEEAREAVNAWVAERTEDRIRDIVPPGAITAATRLVLANAIWFSAGWAYPFPPEATADGAFRLPDGATATVPFMARRDWLAYARGDGFQMVELPYADSGFALTVVLPDGGRFGAVEAGLDVAALDAAVGRLSVTDVGLYLPRFAFGFGAIDLAEALGSMGMADAFDPARADFAGMVDGTPPGPLWIDSVLHKAFISVDEDGTEAAAATVVTMVFGGGPPDADPTEVRVDRPFLFAIRDTATGTLLFLGRVTDPRG